MAICATLLPDRVCLAGRSIDRAFSRAYVLKRHSAGPVCRFLRCQRGLSFLLPANFGKIGVNEAGPTASVHHRRAPHPARQDSPRRLLMGQRLTTGFEPDGGRSGQ